MLPYSSPLKHYPNLPQPSFHWHIHVLDWGGSGSKSCIKPYKAHSGQISNPVFKKQYPETESVMRKKYPNANNQEPNIDDNYD